MLMVLGSSYSKQKSMINKAWDYVLQNEIDKRKQKDKLFFIDMLKSFRRPLNFNIVKE